MKGHVFSQYVIVLYWSSKIVILFVIMQLCKAACFDCSCVDASYCTIQKHMK